MDRTLTSNPRPVTLAPTQPVVQPLAFTLRRLLPLGRHLAWAIAFFLVCAIALAVRLDVQQTHKDLDRTTRMHREARLENERLRLELDARARSLAAEAVAAELAMSGDARLVRLTERQ